uniref:Uncharacterized protein n=1 Tax=Meloidogyne enterolobii TaxID=390850 RepID=A0A6V7WLF5_MELEN|nr:unnamed protein product [Meloidogyne enterolobii]
MFVTRRNKHAFSAYLIENVPYLFEIFLEYCVDIRLIWRHYLISAWI